MTRKYNRGPSESQSNADALARRGREFAAENQTSAGIAYDYRRRQPRDLREAERMVRRAYADEVPTKLHSGTELADDGTPAMTPQFTGYVMGNEESVTTATGDVLGFFRYPFQARLAGMEQGDLAARKHAAIVRHITVGSMDSVPAAIKEGVPIWCAGSVAMIALASFLSGLSDLTVDLARQGQAA